MKKLLTLWLVLLTCFTSAANAGFLIDPYQSFPTGGLPRYSIDFEASTGQRLTIADSDLGVYDRAKFAYSVWYKRESIGEQQFFRHHDTGAAAINIQFDSGNQLRFQVSEDGLATDGTLVTTATFTDTSSWHHLLVWYDSANATAGDRMRLWHDGVEITAFGQDVNPAAAVVNSGQPLYTGGYVGGPYFDGLIYQSAFFSGENPLIGTLYNAGSPVDITALTGLWSVLDTESASPVKDGVLVADWTNVNAVSTSVIHP